MFELEVLRGTGVETGQLWKALDMRRSLNSIPAMLCRSGSFLLCHFAAPLAALALSLGSATGAGPLSQRSLVVALKPNKNPEAMLEEKTALARALTDLLGVKTEVIIPASNAVIVEGFLNGTVDLGFLSGMEVLVAKSQNAGDILLAVETGGSTTYESVWLVRAGDTRASIADFRGRPVAFASRTSTSGGLVPHADLIKRGLLAKGAPPEDFFGKGAVFYGTGYVSAVERVLEGQVEAAAVSDYVFTGGKHLSAEQKSRLRVLQRQGPVPAHVIAARAGLAEADKETISRALLGLNDANTEAAELRERVFGGRFQAVDAAAHLAPLTEALELTGRASDLGLGGAR